MGLRRGRRFVEKLPQPPNTPRGQIIAAISIRDRPNIVNRRRQLGHWESDLVTGSENTHVATLVERRSRATMLVRVASKDATTVTRDAGPGTA